MKQTWKSVTQFFSVGVFFASLFYTLTCMSALASGTEDLQKVKKALNQQAKAEVQPVKAEACATGDCDKSSYTGLRTAEDCGQFKASLSSCAEYAKALSGASK